MQMRLYLPSLAIVTKYYVRVYKDGLGRVQKFHSCLRPRHIASSIDPLFTVPNPKVFALRNFPILELGSNCEKLSIREAGLILHAATRDIAWWFE